MSEAEDEKMQAYRDALRSHDWTHAYSDDHRVWERGNKELRALQGMQRQLDPDHKIWNEIAPDMFKHKPREKSNAAG